MRIISYLKQDFPLPTLRDFGYIFLLICLPNIIFLTLTFYATVSRPLFNIDYLIALFLILLPYNALRFLGILLLILGMFADILMFVVQIFPFMDLAAVRYLISFIPQAPSNYLVLMLFFILFMLSVVFVSLYFSSPKRLKPPYPHFIVSLLLIIGYVAMTLGLTYTNFKAILGRDNYYIANSQTLLYKKIIQDDFTSLINVVPKLEPLDERKIRIAEQLQSPYSDKILFIVAESWGELRNPLAQKEILKNVEAQQHYLDFINSGTSRALGATVVGELRELCGLKLANSGFALGKLDNKQYVTCLPNILKAKNYQTIALHGTSGLLYDRVEWYPKAGFQQALFGENFMQLRRCAAFKGACDSALMGEVVNIFRQYQKKQLFFYWMTLTSHQPYAKQDIYNNRFDCKKFAMNPKGDACRNAQLQTQFFDDLAQMIQNPELQGTEVIVVGDHQPPMWGEDDISQIIPWKISWLHLRVK